MPISELLRFAATGPAADPIPAREHARPATAGRPLARPLHDPHAIAVAFRLAARFGRPSGVALGADGSVLLTCDLDSSGDALVLARCCRGSTPQQAADKVTAQLDATFAALEVHGNAARQAVVAIGASGTASLEERIDLRHVVDVIARESWPAVIAVASVDRVARELSVFERLLAVLRAADVKLMVADTKYADWDSLVAATAPVFVSLAAAQRRALDDSIRRSARVTQPPRNR